MASVGVSQLPPTQPTLGALRYSATFVGVIPPVGQNRAEGKGEWMSRRYARLVKARARHGDDSGVGGQLAVAVAQVERGQQRTDSEVARAAEDDEVAGISHVAHRRGTYEALQTDLGT
jgi:hypothetical protein